jgi:DNA-binding CsgD family transcriptional regulator
MAPPRLLERDAALSAVAALLDRAAAGEGGALFVTGEAGSGKTAVLDAAGRLAAGRFAVGVGRGDVVEAGLPFGVVDQAVRGIGAEGFDLPAAGGRDARAAHFYASVRWLEEAAARQPILLVLDDLHWADPDTLALGVVVCRRIGGLPVAVIGALRRHPPAALEAALGLAAEDHAFIERIEPLSAEAAADLLRERLGGEMDAALAARAFEVTAGNPLLLGEVARSVAGGQVQLPEGRRLVLARLVGGTADELALARAGAVLGRSFRAGDAIALAGLASDAGDAALEALCRNGLLVASDDGRTEFVHALFRQTLYEDVDAPVRLRMHARAFAVLRATGASAAECAENAVAGRMAGDADALATLEAAGLGSLDAGAVSTAAGWLRAAAELGGALMSEPARIALAEALMLDGDGATALGVAQAILDDPRTEALQRARVLALMGRSLFRDGDHLESRRRYRAAVEVAETAGGPLAVEVLLDHAGVELFSTGPRAALDICTRAEQVARGAPAEVRGLVDAALGFCRVLTGDPGGLPVAAAGAAAVELHSTAGRAPTITWYAVAASVLEAHDEADRAFAVAERCAEPGDPVIWSLVAITHADHMARIGHLAAALETAERAAGMAALASTAQPLVGAIQADLLLLAGRAEESAAAWAEAQRSASARGEGMASMWLGLTRLRRLAASTDIPAGCEQVASLAQLADELGLVEPCVVPWEREALAALLRAGDDAGALRLLEQLEERAAPLPCRWPRIVALGVRAALAERSGDLDAAPTYHQQALALHTEVHLPIERCRTLLDQGAYLRRRGDVAGARAVLAEATRDAEELGAEPLARAAHAELALAGGRRRRAADDALTAAELRVARLAAQGATNAEIAAQLFVSAKTVDTHLQHVFAKLGINSRRDLIRRAGQLSAL